MSGSKRARSGDDSTPPIFSWENIDGGYLADESTHEENDSGELEEHLLRLYSTGRLDAKSLCLTCFYAVKAGARGEGLERLAFGPNKQSGKYARHLRDVLPEQASAPEWHFLDLPVYRKGRRSTKPFPLAPPRECLEAELEKLHQLGKGVGVADEGAE